MVKKCENLIEEYIGSIEILDQITLDDFGDKKTVRKNNKLADRLRKIAQIIEQEKTELKVDFKQLLSHEKQSVRGWVAHHILEVMEYDTETRKLALREIHDIAEHAEDRMERLGNSMWLKDWYKKHPEDLERL